MEVPKLILDNITTINIKYLDFDGNEKQGELVCNKKVANELKKIFQEIFELGFPIYQMRPVSEFNNDDIESVKNNNCSCFNFRMVIGSNKLSDHSTGNAVDINPIQNPWVHPIAHQIEGIVREYNPDAKGTVNQQIVDIFKKYGWNWGGIWRNPDYQHFFKADMELKNKVLGIKTSFVSKFKNFVKQIKNVR